MADTKISALTAQAQADIDSAADLIPIVDTSATQTKSGTPAAITAAAIDDATAKTTPVDADTIPLTDSAASNAMKKVTWANVKATFKNYFDTLYQAAGSYLTSANITQTITNGVTDKAPSEDAVYDALALKLDSSTAASTYQPLDSDLTTIAGLTATSDNFIQSKSGSWASRTVAQVTSDLQGTGLTDASVGFRNIPINSQSAAYTTVAADNGKLILHPSTDANARTFTIDSNSNVAYPVGTAITFVNMTSQVVTIAITSDTMYLAGTGTTGSRSLAQYGMATAIKLTSTTWIINGNGLT